MTGLATVAQIEESKMSRRQAWKAFRMGVIASGRRFPLKGQEAQDYWRLMRERFNEWFLSYLHGKADKIAKASGANRTDPFNPPRIVISPEATRRGRGF